MLSYRMICLTTSALRIRRMESGEDRQSYSMASWFSWSAERLLAGLLALFAPLGLLVLVAPVTITLLAVVSTSATAVIERRGAEKQNRFRKENRELQITLPLEIDFQRYFFSNLIKRVFNLTVA